MTRSILIYRNLCLQYNATYVFLSIFIFFIFPLFTLPSPVFFFVFHVDALSVGERQKILLTACIIVILNISLFCKFCKKIKVDSLHVHCLHLNYLYLKLEINMTLFSRYTMILIFWNIFLFDGE